MIGRFDEYRDLLRSDGNEARVFMSVMTGQKVAWGTVRIANYTTYAAILNLGLLTLDWTQTGGGGVILPGMRVVITENDAGFDSGRVKGVMSIRSYGTNNSLTLVVREWTQAYLMAEVGDFVTIYDDVILGDKLVAGTDQFQPDQRPYVDENEVGFPIPSSGGWWAGYIDEQTGRAVARFWGQEAYTSDNNGMPTNSWYCPGATFIEGTGTYTSDAALEFTAPGKYTLQHAVYHPVTGKTKTALIPIRVHQRGVDEPYDVQLESLSGTFEEGWSAKVKVFENADLVSIPDGSPVILWTDHTIQDERFAVPTLHSTDRNHILMVGYLKHDTSTVTPKEESVSFDIINPMQMLKSMPGFSKVMEYNQNPDSWAELSPLTLFRAIIQIASMYTYLIEAGHDLKRVGMPTYYYPAFYLQKQTPLEQMAELALSADSVVTCNRMGGVVIAKRPELYTRAERDDPTLGQWITWLTLDEDDIYAGEDGSEGLTIDREHFRNLEMLQCDGIQAGYYSFVDGVPTNPPFFSRYPGTPGRGTGVEKQEKLITSGQNDLNIRCGHYGAFHDRIHQADDGVIHHVPDITLSLRGAYWNMLDIVGGKVWLDIPASANPRGIELDAFPYIVKGMDIQVQDGAVLTRLTLMGETYSLTPGLTYIVPPPPGTPYTPPYTVTPPNLTLPEPLESPLMGGWQPGYERLPYRIKALSGSSAQFAYTSEIDYTYSTFNWIENSTGLSGAGSGIWFVSDPWSGYRHVYALFTNGLYRNTDIENEDWELIAPYSTITGGSYSQRSAHQIQMSVNRKGYILITVGMNMVCTSTNFGQTWSRTIINIPGSNGEFKQGHINCSTTTNFGTFTTMCHAALSQWNVAGAGRVYVVTRNNYEGNYILGDQTWGYQVWMSDNWGGTFTKMFSGRQETGARDFFGTVVGTATNGPGRLCLPYKKPGGTPNKNNSSQWFYHWSPGVHFSFAFSMRNDVIMRTTGMGKTTTWNVHANGGNEGFPTDILSGGGNWLMGSDCPPSGYFVFPHEPKYHAAIAQVARDIWGYNEWGVTTSTDGGATWADPVMLNGISGGMGQYANVVGCPLATQFLMCFGYKHIDGAQQGLFKLTANGGQVWFGDAPPTFPLLRYTGGYANRPVICAEADLAQYIQPG